MAQIDKTQADVFVGEIWSPGTIRARERAFVFPKRVKRLDFLLGKGGDVVHLPKVTNLTANDVTLATGAFSEQAPLEVDVDVTIDKWKEAAVNIIGIVKAQSNYDLMKEYQGKIGYALGLQQDTDLAGLYSAVTSQIGTSGININEDLFLNAIQLLDEADVPESDRSFAARPAQKRALMKIDRFVDASFTGLRDKKGPVLTGVFGEAYGVMLFFSNTLVSSSGIHNMLWHKDAFCIAMQQGIQMDKKDPSDKLASILVGSTLYGVKVLRADHAIDVLS